MTTAIKSPAANQNLQIRGRCGATGPESVIQTKIATYRRALRNTSPPNPLSLLERRNKKDLRTFERNQ